MKNDNKMTFSEYKIRATKNDVQQLSRVYKPYWWENIVVIGPMIYHIRMGIEVAGIDRGPLRRQITKWNVIFTFALLIYIYSVIMLLTPWLMYGILKISITKTNELIDKKDL